MRRGDIFRIHKPKQDDPKRYRFYVLVSRQDLIDSIYSTVICAPVYTRGRGAFASIPLSIGIDEGLKHDSWIHCDNLRSISKSELTQFVGSLLQAKMDKLNEALQFALDLD
jgi:mRNA interferase MazF